MATRGRRSTSTKKRKPSRNARARRMLRGVAWIVVVLAVVTAFSGNPGPGGGHVGLTFAGFLAFYLVVTKKK